MQGEQKLRSGAHLQGRRNDEVEAQRRRWTFYKVITFVSLQIRRPRGFYERGNALGQAI
jgi:hypothetical protein